MGFSVTDVGCNQKTRDREIKKHTATIHCYNTLSLLQRKISNALLYHAYPELMLKEEHAINIKQLCRLIGYQGNNHAAIKAALKELISTVIEWNLMHDERDGENWTASAIIASVSLEGPTCYYAYSPRMKQLLHSPSLFGKIDLVIQSQFRSSYGLALYENCVRYRGLPQTKWFDLPLFKKLMGVHEESYPVFRDFKRRVLDKAIDEVNAYADLNITSEYGRAGRQVVKVRFRLREGNDRKHLAMTANGSGKSTALEGLKRKLSVFGFSKTQSGQLLSSYEASYLEEKIAIIETSKPYQTGQVRNQAGFLLSALKNDYQVPQPVRQITVNEESERHYAYRALEEEVSAIREQYDRYREDSIYHAIEALSPYEKTALMDAFEKHAEQAIRAVLQLQGHKYSRETVMQSPQLLALLRQFALTELPMTLLHIEAFVESLPKKARDAWEKLKVHDPSHPLLKPAMRVE